VAKARKRGCFVKFLFLLVFAACGHAAMMTRPAYEGITVGSSVSDVKAKVGSPYSIHKQADGTEEYEYIERIPLGTEVVEENRYYLVIKNGQVVSKRMTQETPPVYDHHL
jgi:hypothetical protein